MTIEGDPAHSQIALWRTLTVGPLLFYGLAIIVGAGIYVAIASVIGRAGTAPPLSFLLAGVVAAMTGLCYAELASRFPEASGAAAYVKQGFGSDRAAQATGVALTLAVAIAAASIASGAVHYLSQLIGLPPSALIALLVATFTLLAMAGVREDALLVGTLERHKSHARSQYCFADGLGISSVILLAFNERLHICRWQQSNLVPERLQFASPMMGRRTSFHAHEARCDLAKEIYDLRSPQPPTDCYLSVGSNTVDLENVFREIKTNSGNLHTDGSPQWWNFQRPPFGTFDAGSGGRPPHQVSEDDVRALIAVWKFRLEVDFSVTIRLSVLENSSGNATDDFLSVANLKDFNGLPQTTNLSLDGRR